MKDEVKRMERPELTFIPEVGELVRKHYEDADVILEYGSGGSTVMASEMLARQSTLSKAVVSGPR